ncbi:MAG: efflux RND transporter permease subunit, partial [Anaerolineae bacterium]|nr:efflux RND transporter permease subunit [Anaerolineae bacterium]
MITTIIDRLTRASLRFKWVTLGLALLALVAGVLALTQLKQELIPSIDFPANIVLALNQGAKAEAMRDRVTIPLEKAVQQIKGVVNVQSMTSDGVAYLVIMSEFGLDQEALRAQVRNAIEGIAYPAGMATPELLTFGMDDLPLVYASVSADRPLAELKELVKSDIAPALEEVPGIADVQVSGGQELPAEPSPTQEPAPERQPTPEPTPTTAPTTAPAGGGSALPPMWQAAGKAQGINLATAGDVTPQIIRQLASAAPQLLGMLTAENLRDFSPEVLAWLPASYIETLDPELRAELDQLAQPAGGLGALAVAAEAEAAALAANAPPLSGAWVQQAEGSTTGPMFETAADLITSGYTDSAAEFLNLLVANMPQAPQLVADLTPDVIAWLVGQEQGFLENLSPVTLRLLSPAVLSSLPESFYAGLDADLRAELQGIASGTAAAFIPEDTVATVDGNPGLILMIYQDGEANTVSASHDLYDKMEALEAAYPGLRFEVTFEQASFIEESISGVTREGALGALFAVLVILIFLSGTINGRYRPAWRSTLVTGVSIPLSVFMAFALLKWLPPVTDLALIPLANATQGIPVLGTIVTLIHRLFPSDFTLNIMTLSGMTVAVGRVVDDSIVVLENIYR